MLTDPVADMLTRIRNANKALQETVSMPTSNLKTELVPVGQWAPSFDAVGRVLPDSPVDLATRGITTDGQRVGADVDRILALLNDHV